MPEVLLHVKRQPKSVKAFFEVGPAFNPAKPSTETKGGESLKRTLSRRQSRMSLWDIDFLATARRQFVPRATAKPHQPITEPSDESKVPLISFAHWQVGVHAEAVRILEKLRHSVGVIQHAPGKAAIISHSPNFAPCKLSKRAGSPTTGWQ